MLAVIIHEMIIQGTYSPSSILRSSTSYVKDSSPGPLLWAHERTRLTYMLEAAC